MGSSGSKLSKADAQYLSKNTNYVMMDIKSLHKSFNQDFPSGKMTKKQAIDSLYEGMVQAHLPGDPYGIPSLMFSGYNSKKPDSVDVLEFIVGTSNATGDDKGRAKWCFDVYDQKKTGKLKYKDFLLVQREVFKMHGLAYEAKEKATEASEETTNELSPENKCQTFFKLLSKDYKTDTVDFKEFTELVKLDKSARFL